jgi:hypothetical protein
MGDKGRCVGEARGARYHRRDRSFRGLFEPLCSAIIRYHSDDLCVRQLLINIRE